MTTTIKTWVPAIVNQPGYPIPRGGCYVWPWGDGSGPGEVNLYPQEMRRVFLENGIVQNALRRKFELIWGAGPALYTSRFTGGRRKQEWVRREEIEAWLDTWDFRGYLEKALGEFLLMNGIFTRSFCDTVPYHLPAIIKLEFISCDLGRYKWNGDDSDPVEFLIGDYAASSFWGFQEYPIYDSTKIRFNREMVAFDTLPQSCVDDYYPRSALHGSLSWITAGNQTSRIITAFNQNYMAIKYHVEVPAIYWQNQRERLQQHCLDEGIMYTERMLDRLKNETFEKIASALSGTGNAGKFISTEIILDELHQKHVGWKITPLDHGDIGAYFSGQTKIARESSFNIASGLGLHPSITDITRAGGFSAGGQYEYAAKIFKQVSVDITESIVTRKINEAIQINFEGSGVKIGFDRDNI